MATKSTAERLAKLTVTKKWKTIDPSTYNFTGGELMRITFGNKVLQGFITRHYTEYMMSCDISYGTIEKVNTIGWAKGKSAIDPNKIYSINYSTTLLDASQEYYVGDIKVFEIEDGYEVA